MNRRDRVTHTPAPLSSRNDITGDKAFLAMQAVIYETVDLFHRLVFVHEQMHGMSPVKRGILMSLGQLGPQTVQQLTRTRPVSRQYIQKVVNQLHEDGLVEFIDNPAHKRSSLVRVTKSGLELLEMIQHREANLFSQIALSVETNDLENAVQVLRSLRQFFESNTWLQIVQETDASEYQ